MKSVNNGSLVMHFLPRRVPKKQGPFLVGPLPDSININ
jgi:hypothetical protein